MSVFPARRRWVGMVSSFAAVLLAIEFLDELVFGTREAAWPQIRRDLGLSYTQIGLLLGIPNVVSAVIEPAFGVLGDTRWRTTVMVAGGVSFSIAFASFGAAFSFPVALVALVVLYPASGAFVSLSQATLMDVSGDQHERAMAQWTFAGSVGGFVGPLVLALAVLLGGNWRGPFLAFSVVAAVLTVSLARARPARNSEEGERPNTSTAQALAGALQALRKGAVWKWLFLLAASDLMLDVLLGFLALYLVDERGFSTSIAGFGVAVWMGVGLAGDGAMIVILRRVAALAYVRVASATMAVVFAAFLVFPPAAWSFIALGLLGFLNSGSYAVLKAQLYRALPGQSGTVVTVSAGFGIVTALIPTLLGVVADHAGVGTAMWLLLAGPLAVAVFARGGYGSPQRPAEVSE